MPEYVRWYDKDKYLGAFMMLLENLPSEIQVEVANDMLLNIHLVLKEKHDNFINSLFETSPIFYKRWYDFSPALHSAVESMQNLNKDQREELILMISDIIFKYTNKDFSEVMEKLGTISSGQKHE